MTKVTASRLKTKRKREKKMTPQFVSKKLNIFSDMSKKTIKMRNIILKRRMKKKTKKESFILFKRETIFQDRKKDKTCEK